MIKQPDRVIDGLFPYRLCGRHTCDMYDPHKSGSIDGSTGWCWLQNAETKLNEPCFFWKNMENRKGAEDDHQPNQSD